MFQCRALIMKKSKKPIDLSKKPKSKPIDIAELSHEAYATNDRLQIQEIVNEKQRIHQKMMEDLIANHKNYDPEGYYIVVISKNDYSKPNVIKTKYIVRSTKPNPDWSQDLYYYDNKNDALYFIYSLPKMEDTVYFKKNGDLFRSDWIEPYMKAIDAMMDGTLSTWDAPCKRKEHESVLTFDAQFGIPEKKLIL